MQELNVPLLQPQENNRAYAYRVLRMNIMTLRLRPGELLNEAGLTAALHMSRTPIHEALTALKDEWLVEILPQRGTRVTQIDPSLVKEGYAARLLLEGELLRDEAGKISHTQGQRLIHCLKAQEEQMERAPQDIDAFIHLDDEMHGLMYEFGGRHYTWLALRRLVSHYDRSRYLDAMDGNADFSRVLRQHREFCDYLIMGLPENVNPHQKISDHLTSFRGNLLDTISRYPDYFTL